MVQRTHSVGISIIPILLNARTMRNIKNSEAPSLVLFDLSILIDDRIFQDRCKLNWQSKY